MYMYNMYVQSYACKCCFEINTVIFVHLVCLSQPFNFIQTKEEEGSYILIACNLNARKILTVQEVVTHFSKFLYERGHYLLLGHYYMSKNGYHVI